MRRISEALQLFVLTAARFAPYEFFGGLVMTAAGSLFLLTHVESAPAPTVGFEPVVNAIVIAWFSLIVGVALLSIACARGLIRRSASLAVVTQYEPASQELVAAFLAEMQKEGRFAGANAELVRVRSMYGEEGVRNGHILWIMKKLDNQVPAGTPPPPFTPPHSEM
jgi:hypothetical protein